MLMARITVEFTICFGDFFLLIKIVKSRHRSPMQKYFMSCTYICKSTCYSIDAKGVLAYIEAKAQKVKHASERKGETERVNTTGAVGKSLPA